MSNTKVYETGNDKKRRAVLVGAKIGRVSDEDFEVGTDLMEGENEDLFDLDEITENEETAADVDDVPGSVE